MPLRPIRTPLEVYYDRWGKGCGNDICAHAKHVCHVRGDLPCDVFFVGEAPGESEDCLGAPFVGPAGQLLDTVIAAALGGRTVCKVCQRGGAFGLDRYRGKDDSGPLWYCDGGHGGEESRPVRYALTNLVGCIPRDVDTGRKITDGPDAEEIVACAPRLEQLLEIGSPRLIVCVGALAKTWLKKGYKNPTALPPSVRALVDILHPAAILRGSIAQRGLSVQRCVATISTALEDLE